MLILKPMTKNKISERLKGLTVGLVCSVLLVGGIVLANTYYADMVNVYQNEESEENFGGVTFEKEDFTEGFDVNSVPIYDTYGNEYYNIDVTCSTDDRATTTAEDGGTGISTGGYAAETICYWQNPISDKDLVVEDLYLDVTETFSAASTMSVATTTSGGTMPTYPFNQWRTATSGTLTVIASTTVATTKDSQLTGFIGIENYPGTVIDLFGGKADATNAFVTSTKFILDADDFIVVSWHPFGFASTGALTIAGAQTGNVILKGKAYVRGE